MIATSGAASRGESCRAFGKTCACPWKNEVEAISSAALIRQRCRDSRAAPAAPPASITFRSRPAAKAATPAKAKCGPAGSPSRSPEGARAAIRPNAKAASATDAATTVAARSNAAGVPSGRRSVLHPVVTR